MLNNDFARRRVLVTGASSGIGLATSLELARLGFQVIGAARSDDGADVLRSEANRAGVSVSTTVFDLADESSYRQLIPSLDLWAVVNNASYPNAGAIEDVPLADVRIQLEAMVVAPAAVALAALPSMRRRGSGRIVNVGSVAVGSGVPMLGWYLACKHALAGLTEVLRNELSGSHIHVISVDPSTIDTPIWDRTHLDLQRRYRGSSQRASYERAMWIIDSLRRWMRSPDTVAKAVGRALVSGKPRASYTVGFDVHLLAMGSRVVPRRMIDSISRTVLDA